MILYVGPDQIIPLSGALGTIAGLALMFWGKVLEGFRRLANLFAAKETEKN
jgi:hypothetical protein